MPALIDAPPVSSTETASGRGGPGPQILVAVSRTLDTETLVAAAVEVADPTQDTTVTLVASCGSSLLFGLAATSPICCGSLGSDAERAVSDELRLAAGLVPDKVAINAVARPCSLRRALRAELRRRSCRVIVVAGSSAPRLRGVLAAAEAEGTRVVLV